MIKIIDSREAELIKAVPATGLAKNETRYGELFREDQKALNIQPIEDDPQLVFDDMLQTEIKKLKSKSK